jgi:predicted transcriptional regulator
MRESDAQFFKENYHEILKHKMIEKGMRIRDVAKKAEITYQAVNEIMKGNGGRIGVLKVCNALKMSVRSIMR